MKRLNPRIFLRVEIHATLGRVGWSWRITEPVPGRNAVLRESGRAPFWTWALIRAGYELWKLWRQAS